MTTSVNIEITPSIVSAPLLHLQSALNDLEKANVNMLHIDLEDGHFVPVMNLGTRILEELGKYGRFDLDVHLMVDNPELIVPEVVRLGATAIAIHYEASMYPRRNLKQIRDLGVMTGLALNPKTPLPELDYISDLLDFVILLTTEPEEQNCPFIPESLEKIRSVRLWADRYGRKLGIVADGGIDTTNISSAIRAGADRIVAGRSVFSNGKITENLVALQKAGSQ